MNRMRLVLTTCVLAGFGLAAPSCCLIFGPAQNWSFATVCPQNRDLIGLYEVSVFGSQSILGSSPTWIRLSEDGVFEYGVDGAGRGASREVTSSGTWKVEPIPGTSNYKLVLADPQKLTPLELIIWHNSPKHKLWIEFGDPDSGDGLLYRFDEQRLPVR